MPLKVTWKKGMRLSTDVFNALDRFIEENIRLASIVASDGQYGLFNALKPFELSVNVHNNILEVVSLSCHGITKSGKIIDIDFDSNFTATFDTRVSIPSGSNDDAFFLIIKMHENETREINDLYSESSYTFELLGENSSVDSNSLLIGRIVNQFGWRLDETDFVPPCLYISAHQRYVELLEKTKFKYKEISDMCLTAKNCVARMLLSSIWNSVSSEFINLDKDRYALTPGSLLASLQKTVSSFVIGCNVDEYVSLENADPFVAYINIPYNARNIYHDIEKGLDLCSEISVKMEAVCKMVEIRGVSEEKPKSKPQPTVEQKARWSGIEI